MIRSKTLKNRVEYDYEFHLPTKDANGESIVGHRTTPVPMIEVFYDLGEGEYPENLSGFFIPPTQKTFVKLMFEKCKLYSEGDHSEFFSAKFEEAWKNRFKLAWASFIRDVHFNFMISESNFYDKWNYKIEKDRIGGADSIIDYEGKTYYVNLFVSSNKSRSHLKRKKSDSQRVSKNGTDVYVPMYSTGPKTSAQTRPETMWLFSDKHIEGLKRIITSNATSYEVQNRNVAYIQT